jgi:hypothetical protein
MKYDPLRLLKLLKYAALPVEGADETGRIDFLPEATEQQQAQAAQILIDYPTLQLPEELDETAAQQAKTDFRALPQWATWSPVEGRDYVHGAILSGQSAEEVEAWIDTNVTTLAQAKVALKLLARNLVVMREIVSLIALALLYLRDVAVRKL